MSQIDDLIQELKTYPVNSNSFTLVKAQVEKILADYDHYKDFVVCFPTPLNPKRSLLLSYDSMNHMGGLRKVSEFSEGGSSNKKIIFSPVETFGQDKRFSYTPRYKAEFDPNFTHIVMGAYITDGVRVVLLNSYREGVPPYTLIYKHAVFKDVSYIKSQMDYLRDSAIECVNDAVTLPDIQLEAITTPKYYYSVTNNVDELMHFYVIYEIKVSDVKTIISSINSKKPDKFGVVSLKLDMFNAYKGMLEPIRALPVISDVKKHYLGY